MQSIVLNVDSFTNVQFQMSRARPKQHEAHLHTRPTIVTNKDQERKMSI
jgi:hypothetical protein